MGRRSTTAALLGVIFFSTQLFSVTASCLSLPCQNGGICNDQDFCECPYLLNDDGTDSGQLEYYGDSCEHLNPCLDNPCKHDSPCEPFYDNSRSFQCSCSNGYTGTFCEIAPECDGIVCLNGGWCESNHLGCWCQDDYYGDRCQYKDLCYAKTCGEFGECNPDTGLCECDNGYYGEGCNLDDLCFEVTCQNGGTCNQETGFCECIAGYFGVECEENDSCTGPDGPIECLNGGYCENEDPTQYVCICAPGFYGKDCELIDFCFEVECNEGTCSFGECTCNEGYTGEFCDEALNEEEKCDPNPCKFQGTCVPDETYSVGYYCDCVDGTTGLNCDVIVGTTKCDSNPCLHGSCHSDDSKELGFYCVCEAGFSGDFCNVGTMPTPVSGTATPTGTMTTSETVTVSGSSTIEYPSMPPTCADYPTQDPTDKTLSMRMINDMATLLKNNFASRSTCWDLVKMRIYGRLAFSKSLLTDGHFIQNHIEAIESAESDQPAIDFAKIWYDTFRDSFSECDESSCVIETLCNNVFNKYTFGNEISEEIVSQIRGSCMQEAWRFNDFINKGSLEGICEFSFVPVAFADVACEKCRD